MNAKVVSRILGFILFAIIGWLIGTIWAGSAQLTVDSLTKILRFRSSAVSSEPSWGRGLCCVRPPGSGTVCAI